MTVSVLMFILGLMFGGVIAAFILMLGFKTGELVIDTTNKDEGEIMVVGLRFDTNEDISKVNHVLIRIDDISRR